MVGTIARKEFLEIIRDGRFRLSAGVILLLLLAALAAGWKHTQEVSRERAAAHRDAREVWLNQGSKNPHSAAHYGTYAFKPQLPLAFLDGGVDPYVGTAIYLEAHKQNAARFLPAQDRTALQRFGELTAAVVLQILVPLVIILLAFAAFAGEREAGTLRQLLSVGVRRRDLTWGKMLGIGGALLSLLLPATLIGGVALALSSARESFAPGAARVVLMTLGYLLYFGALLGVSLAVSASVRSARLALIVLLGFWIFNSLVAPRVAADLSKRIAPAPPASEFWENVQRDTREGFDGHNPRDRRALELQERTLRQYGVSRVEDLPVNFGGLALQASEEYSNLVFDRHFGSLWDAYERQQRIQQLGGIAAPLLAIRALSMSLAGTDFSHHRRFAAAAEQYRREMVKELNDDLAYNSRSQQDYRADRSLWERIADFNYAQPGIGWALRNQLPGVLILALWFVAANAAALITAARIKVL